MAQNVAERKALGSVKSEVLFNFGFCAQIFLEFTQFRLGQLLGNLRFDLLQWRQLCFAHVIDTDDVKTELAFDRGLSELAFFQA